MRKGQKMTEEQRVRMVEAQKKRRMVEKNFKALDAAVDRLNDDSKVNRHELAPPLGSVTKATFTPEGMTFTTKKELELQEIVENQQRTISRLSNENAELKKYSNGRTAEHILKLLRVARELSDLSQSERLVVAKFAEELNAG